jgi:hypothetical protein
VTNQGEPIIGEIKFINQLVRRNQSGGWEFVNVESQPFRVIAVTDPSVIHAFGKIGDSLFKDPTGALVLLDKGTVNKLKII